jgi:hypothetical protein
MKTQEERYIEMRNKNQYDIGWFYEYYMQESKDKNMNFNKFQMVFQSHDLNTILEHIDDKFKLDKLYDNKNNLIKVYKSSNY